jgi:hypothetical protein
MKNKNVIIEVSEMYEKIYLKFHNLPENCQLFEEDIMQKINKLADFELDLYSRGKQMTETERGRFNSAWNDAMNKTIETWKKRDDVKIITCDH